MVSKIELSMYPSIHLSIHSFIYPSIPFIHLFISLAAVLVDRPEPEGLASLDPLTPSLVTTPLSPVEDTGDRDKEEDDDNVQRKHFLSIIQEFNTDVSFNILCTVVVLFFLTMYMKIHVPSMLAIGVDKHTQQTNKQPQWLNSLSTATKGLENIRAATLA